MWLAAGTIDSTGTESTYAHVRSLYLLLLRKLTYSAYRLFLKLSSLTNFSHALNVLKVGQKGKDNT